MNTVYDSFSFSPISAPVSFPIPAISDDSHQNNVLAGNLKLLLDRLQQKKTKHLAKLNQLKEDLGHLEGDALALSDREQRLRTLLERIAREGEEDLAAERRRRELLARRLESISRSIGIARACYPMYDTLYWYWRTNCI
eukprot:TRINITY_DN7593_c0_g1_i3.p1 TRINITY_DN7593_c0_g1~~TRINITY_DN7593_c0_g1_i3.p1  ORF type:complete len:139 (+),score=21.20 TRINITY_DN7593_c0_g1_i3:154-570(+)